MAVIEIPWCPGDGLHQILLAEAKVKRKDIVCSECGARIAVTKNSDGEVEIRYFAPNSSESDQTKLG